MIVDGHTVTPDRASRIALGVTTRSPAGNWRQTGATVVPVPSIQVKDVPDDVHAVLRKRAAAAGQSLQEYLLAHLTAEARQPTVSEVLERAGKRTGGARVSSEDIVAIIRDDRDRVH